MHTSTSRLVVVLDDGDEVPVECCDLSFDGGSLICFKQTPMTGVVAAFSPTGWKRCYWDQGG